MPNHLQDSLSEELREMSQPLIKSSFAPFINELYLDGNDSYPRRNEGFSSLQKRLELRMWEVKLNASLSSAETSIEKKVHRITRDLRYQNVTGTVGTFKQLKDDYKKVQENFLRERPEYRKPDVDTMGLARPEQGEKSRLHSELIISLKDNLPERPKIAQETRERLVKQQVTANGYLRELDKYAKVASKLQQEANNIQDSIDREVQSVGQQVETYVQKYQEFYGRTHEVQLTPYNTNPEQPRAEITPYKPQPSDEIFAHLDKSYNAINPFKYSNELKKLLIGKKESELDRAIENERDIEFKNYSSIDQVVTNAQQNREYNKKRKAYNKSYLADLQKIVKAIKNGQVGTYAQQDREDNGEPNTVNEISMENDPEPITDTVSYLEELGESLKRERGVGTNAQQNRKDNPERKTNGIYTKEDIQNMFFK
jgi:hypothetical protein